MSTVASTEVEAHLPDLLLRVRQGESITITHHGVPVALLMPVAPPLDDVNHAIKEMKEFGRARKLPVGVTVKDLIEEGRRF